MTCHAKDEIALINSEDCCCICLQSLETEGLGRQTLPCGHVMHELCVMEMRRLGSSDCCPLCRESHTDLTPLQALVDDANLHYIRKVYDKCANCALRVLELDMTHAHMNVLLGELYHNGMGVTADLDRAREFYEEAHSAGIVEVIVSLGLLYQEQGNIGKALEIHEKGRSLGLADSVFYLGMLWKQQGNIPRAMELFEEAHHKGQLDATLNLGVHHNRQGNYNKALEYFKLASNQGNVTAMSNLGALYRRLGNIAEAKRCCERAYRVGGHMSAAVNLGVLYLEEGNVRKALELWLEACQEGHTEAMNKLANLYLQVGNVKGAAELCEKSRCLGSVGATTMLGSYYYKQGDVGKAEALWKEAHRMGDTEATKNLRELYHEKIKKMQDIPAGACETEKSATSQLEEQGLLDVMPNQMSHQSNGLTLTIGIGDYVWIHDLKSSSGQLLNGVTGTVVGRSPCGQRFKVEIANIGLKSIKPENLSLIAVPPSEPAPISPDEMNAQVAIEASLQEANSSPLGQHEGDVNAQVSGALRRSMMGDLRPHILQKYSRQPKAFVKALLEADELASWRRALEENGCPVQLKGGAQGLAFVKPENYQPVMKAIELGGWKLYPENVVVDPDVDAIVVAIVNGIPKKEKVYPRGRSVIPTGLGGMADECHVTVTKTFIDICYPSSDGPKTATTTDADDRKPKNPRPTKKNAAGSSG